MIGAGNYLQRLTTTLHEKACHIEPAIRNRHISFIMSQQEKDGGFHGRDGGSDLYYTGFALRSLAILGGLNPPVCESVARFLRNQLQSQTSLLDFFSLVYGAILVSVGGGPDVFEDSGDWPTSVRSFLGSLRRPDGGFTKNPQSSESSTYMSFLALLCHQLLAGNPPEVEALKSFVLSRQRPDGGFVEYGPMRKSGTNPTAAGFGILRALSKDNLDADLADRGRAFFLGMLGEEGGFKANGRIPFSDVLSTFTSLWSLEDMGGVTNVPLDRVKAFLDNVALPGGGFRGGSWDAGADVEYTFYGLGSLALIYGTGKIG